MQLDFLDEVPSACRKPDFGQELIREFAASGRPAALVRLKVGGQTDVEVIRIYSKLRATALRLYGEQISVVKRGHSIYLKRNDEYTGGRKNG